MKSLILVGIGGSLGSILRYALGKYISEKKDWVFPVGTFLINITGAFLLGILVSMNLEESWMSLLGDGFLGAYTTFSTFSYEGIKFIEEGFIGKAIFYMLGSVLIGVAAFYLGFAIGR